MSTVLSMQKRIPTPPERGPISIARLLWRLTLPLFVTLVISGCDMSESEGLLNPTLADSTMVRVLNLTDEPLNSVRLGTDELAAAVPVATASAARAVWSIERTTLTITAPSSIDTVRNVRLATSVDDPLLVTWIVYPSADSNRALQIAAGRAEQGLLEASDDARIYFFNGVEGRALVLRQGCRNGPVAFAETAGAGLGGSRDFSAGEFSFYLFDSTAELASARLRVAPGEILGLVAMRENSGGVAIRAIDLRAGSGGSATTLEPLPPENRSTGQVTIINALTAGSLDVSMLGTGETIVEGLGAGQTAPPATLQVCRSPEGDTLLVVRDGADTARLPYAASVGESTRVVVYDDGSGIRTIDLGSGLPSNGRVNLRAVNLATRDTVLSLVVGAGAPGTMSRGSLLFPSLRAGAVTSYRELDPGLYPLSIEYSSSGFFVDGGLQQLDPGAYTLLIVDGAEGPVIRMLVDGANPRLSSLAMPAERSILFSGHPGSPVTFSITTDAGRLTVPEVAYSYVYPTVLPPGPVTVEIGGLSQSRSIGDAGTILGWTGREGEAGDIVTIDRLGFTPGSGEALIRFLNAARGSGSLAIREESDTGSTVATTDYLVPSDEIVRDARRFTFVVTPNERNDELTRVSAVQLSQGRAYVLVVVPSGATTGQSGTEYATIFLQE